MKMIVGLGNPGSEYAGTRHNVGWMLVDALAEHFGINEWRSREKGMVAEGRIGSEKILLVKPLTYMNNSGECVGSLMRWYKLEPEDIMAAHDDMDIPIGTIRIRKNPCSVILVPRILAVCGLVLAGLSQAGALSIMCWLSLTTRSRRK